MRGRKGNHALKKVMGFMIDYFVFKLKNFKLNTRRDKREHSRCLELHEL
jgi:hypothetical protein